jgi:hypothetical protein
MVDTNYNLIPKSFYKTEDGASTLTVDKKQADAVQAGVQARLDDLPPAEKKAFLAMTANLAPGDVDTPKKLDIVLDAFEAAAKLVDDDAMPMAFVGDIAKFLARAMIEFAGEQRQNALNDRLAARQHAKAELLEQAGKMDAAADKMKSGAITALVIGAVGGALSVAGSASSAVGTARQLGSMTKSMKSTQAAAQNASKFADDFSNLNKLSQHTSGVDAAKIKSATAATKASQKSADVAHDAEKAAFDVASTKAQMFTSLGQVSSATGDIGRSGSASADTLAQAEAKKIDAEGARDAAEAQYAQQTADMKKELQESLNEMIKQIINFIKEMKDAEVDAMRALTRV